MDDHINNLYEADFLAWINTQAELLRAKHFDQLDLENLVEELEGMARKEKHELKHRLEQLIMHLLKCKLQPEHISGSWRGTIREQRIRIQDLLEAMPSLTPLVDAYMERSYTRAAALAADDTGMSRSAFPATMPFSKAQLLDPDYIP
ncbi:DUF29 domain-containing protein [Duganella sp. CT11-25]|jgi:hypothetical protein|uniref:DUF29 domain-containing protein n=1 Tax=unclassified Duganella TaxID=2636909 RepID=UPI0039AF31B6